LQDESDDCFSGHQRYLDENYLNLTAEQRYEVHGRRGIICPNYSKEGIPNFRSRIYSDKERFFVKLMLLASLMEI